VNSSLASQAVAPLVSDIEISAPGRTRLDVGRGLARGKRNQGKKVVKLRPLAKQQVSPTDSVLGSMSRWPQTGLLFNRYDKMIQAAFREKWWNSKQLIRVNVNGTTTVVAKNSGKHDDDLAADDYALIQYNFSLFFGIAVQLYEATLVSDDTPSQLARRGRTPVRPWHHGHLRSDSEVMQDIWPGVCRSAPAPAAAAWL
jgi:hypothetical protein